MQNGGQRQSYGRPSCSSNANVEPPTYGKYYVYSSNPTLSHSDRTRKARAGQSYPKRNIDTDDCHHSHNTNIRTKGAHEFYNMMWDPSVYRGRSSKSYQAAEMERCRKKRAMDDPLIKRRKYPRHQKKLGGIVMPETIHQETIKVGFGDMGIQTEQFLEERTTDTAKNDMCTQVDAKLSKAYGGNMMFRHNSIGMENSSQTECDSTCPFGPNMKRIQKVLPQKILEQSLLEVTEETELALVRKENRTHVQRQRDEAFRVKTTIESQRALADIRATALALERQESMVERDAEKRLGAAVFSVNSIGNLISSTFNQLRRTMSEEAESLEDQDAMNDEVVVYFKTRSKASRQILDGMLSEVTSLREAETAEVLFRQSARISTTSSEIPQSLSSQLVKVESNKKESSSKYSN